MPGAVHSLRSVAVGLGAIAAAACATTGPASAGEVLYANEGNRMLRIDLGSASGGEPGVLIERASEEKPGGAAVGRRRDVNGRLHFRRKPGTSGEMTWLREGCSEGGAWL